jgi:uncharacterized protein (TIGR02270 family)
VATFGKWHMRVRAISSATMQALSNILSQHAEGASFLWELRSGAVVAPHYNLADLAKLDQRVEANLDGLRTAGNAGWEVCREALSSGQSGEVFAAAVLALGSGNKDRLETVFEAGTASQELSRGLISALGWLTFQQAVPPIQQLLASSSGASRRVGIAASAIHRKNPGAPLLDATRSADLPLKTRALRAMGELGLRDYLSELEPHLADADALTQFSAAWSLSLLSSDSRSANSKALAILQSIAESSLPYREKALQAAIRRLDVFSAGAWQNKLAQDPNLIRLAVVAAGALGDPANIPWLIEQMKLPELARVGGEAFTMITGVDIAFQDLDCEKPKGFEAGPSGNPQDGNVEMEPDENLPWPNQRLIAKWWTEHHAEFQNGARYLAGKPISLNSCQQVLRDGRQRQRAAAALEIAMSQPGQPLFNIAAPGFRQQKLLGLQR